MMMHVHDGQCMMDELLMNLSLTATQRTLVVHGVNEFKICAVQRTHCSVAHSPMRTPPDCCGVPFCMAHQCVFKDLVSFAFA
jgi:hypothetical protein